MTSIIHVGPSPDLPLWCLERILSAFTVGDHCRRGLKAQLWKRSFIKILNVQNLMLFFCIISGIEIFIIINVSTQLHGVILYFKHVVMQPCDSTGNVSVKCTGTIHQHDQTKQMLVSEVPVTLKYEWTVFILTETKDQWARDDPAFLVLLSIWLFGKFKKLLLLPLGSQLIIWGLMVRMFFWFQCRPSHLPLCWSCRF